MARTTATAVKGILRLGSQGGDYDDANNPSLVPFIDSAALIVNRVVQCAARKNITLSDEELEMVERWLSAHMYAMSDRTYTNKSTGGASASFAGQTAMGFEATLYGQTAMRIDYSGCLTNFDKSKTASAQWLGKPPSQQTAYADRS